MANYYGAARSNYFKVKDVDALKEDLKGTEIMVDTRDGLVCLLCNDEGGWPSWKLDSENFDEEEFVLTDVLASHLEGTHVAIIMEAGAEKLRYLTGYAQAVNAKGEVKTVSLDDIYDMAKSLGNHITRAEY